MNILKFGALFGAFKKMVQNLTFWTAPKLAIFFQSIWDFSTWDLTVLKHTLLQNNIFKPIVTSEKMTGRFSQIDYLKVV
jgi:hypothetical protein